MIDLEPLLALQERDLALDRLRHRRETLPERATLAAAEARAATRRTELEDAQAERDEVLREERALDDEARALADHAVATERRLYSGEISSPRELQALQSDVDQLRRHQRSVEDRQLGVMERREPLDQRVTELEAELAALAADTDATEAALRSAEQVIDAEIAVEEGSRGEIVSGIAADLVTEYERCRAKANGVGAARLVGSTCQGCHLSIPATEVDRIRRGASGEVAHCDNCGCILVP